MTIVPWMVPDRLIKALGHIDGALPGFALGPTTLRAIARPGWTVADGKVHARSLAAAIDRLYTAKLPLAAVYMSAVPWEVGFALRDAVTRAFCAPYVLLDDFWAFRIAPGTSGWPAHRGVYRRLDRDRPAVLNAWVALGDVPVTRSCMHLLSLEEDEGYREDDLERELEKRMSPVPMDAGRALLWNANVLHHGGDCLASEREPRRSITFTIKSRAAAVDDGDLWFDGPPRDPWQLLESVARQIEIYGSRDPLTTPDHLGWSRGLLGMRAVLSRT